MSDILEQNGYDVQTAANLNEVEKAIGREFFDMIFLDFKLPKINGIELLKKIKSRVSKSKIFIISGRPFLDKIIKEEKSLNLISGYFNKPFDINLLLKKIKNI